MKKVNKIRVISIVYSLFFFLSVVVLTHDYFDDFDKRDNILLLLLGIQLSLVLYITFFVKKNKTN